MKDHLRQLVELYAQAERSGDTALLKDMLHDDFLAIGPLGFILNKTEWIDRFAGDDFHYESLTIDETAIREFKETAIAVSRQEQVGVHKGQEVRAELRVSHIFIKSGEDWKLVGVQMSPIGPPPQFNPRPQTN